MGGSPSKISAIVKRERNDPEYAGIGDDIQAANKVLGEIRSFLKIPDIEVLFEANIGLVEESLKKVNGNPHDILLLMTYIDIVRLDSIASSLFVSCVTSNADIFKHNVTMNLSDKWPRNCANIVRTKAIMHGKNQVIHRTLTRAVGMSRNTQFVMSKILTGIQSLFRVLERIDSVHAEKVALLSRQLSSV